MNRIKTPLLALLLCLPLAAQAATGDGGVNAEIRREMAGSRAEVRAEMAAARAELDRENLSLGDSLRFGKRTPAKRAASTLPPAQITPAGDLLINDTAVALTAQQRRLLLDYRGQVLDLAKAGIDAGEKAALVALEATDVSLFSLVMGGLTGSLERRVEKSIKQEIAPMLTRLCQRLPAVRASQQALASSVPQFAPYATLEQDDVDNCDSELRRDIASR